MYIISKRPKSMSQPRSLVMECKNHNQVIEFMTERKLRYMGAGINYVYLSQDFVVTCFKDEIMTTIPKDLINHLDKYEARVTQDIAMKTKADFKLEDEEKDEPLILSDKNND